MGTKYVKIPEQFLAKYAGTVYNYIFLKVNYAYSKRLIDVRKDGISSAEYLCIF